MFGTYYKGIDDVVNFIIVGRGYETDNVLPFTEFMF